ncbi:cytochrome c4 [Polynucleobacter sp. MWH-Spelu-300-X4]|jgi:cbb3-type cytochrome c oxidase subunit III|uniref:c-type cytochrome n=1 Tax=Polynucleobacter sp. MWH-Spelu-300-X4 TaxID=2689109 RepID=UPI001BFE6BC6|nr:c-type cytochrome [Polynucleobacter sp. MWH-Spelu-300-X4]QWD79838.1 cytochrome c4 [Polynucleobacter sp. MWH-Spelu-300-X4]
MRQTISATLKTLVLAAGLSLAAMTFANEPVAATAPDAAKGEALYNNGDAKRGVAACMGCHGANGVSGGGAYPKLAGQHASYVVKQLKDYKAGKDRPNAVMSAFAGLLSDEDMANVAAYVSKQTPGLGTAKNKASIELGQKIYRGGIAGKSVAACAGCHGPNGSGIPAQFPRISGQWPEYTEAQLVAYRAGDRKNSVQMSAIAAKMSDAEIKAVADYVAGLR